MAQEIEIEYKNLLTKEEFKILLDKLPFPEYSVKQSNYYFETKEFALKEKGCALRIREKNGKYRLTLKEPHELGLQETHDVLTEEEANQWINGHIIPKPEVMKQIHHLGVNPHDLVYFGKLITERREVSFQNTLLVLDYSTYNEKEDYEFELEAPDEDTGIETFHSILTEFGIKKKTTPNKIKRFFKSLEK
ncbi:CYTH domain-containing protein [Oceanobacillus halophilus]|uniref:CYTH domain-containing protein n=1 Tax=Oceanobacillus halophilus TaxID=930130 RepID=A0A495A179_9BACI|nr:CYTH domain-containing protein [Oceanobacillus halophilus]RKQ32634.1 CYTH domain-containing protein [Oceanobacillus halophilus]